MRRSLVALLAIFAGTLTAQAQPYPSLQITLVVPFPPGASNDILGRYEADVLGRALHGSFVVENKPGAGGDIGISFAAKANPDGYTLLHAPSAITLLPSLAFAVGWAGLGLFLVQKYVLKAYSRPMAAAKDS